MIVCRVAVSELKATRDSKLGLEFYIDKELQTGMDSWPTKEKVAATLMKFTERQRLILVLLRIVMLCVFSMMARRLFLESEAT